MDWAALQLSLKLAICTMLLLLPIGIWAGRLLAWTTFRNKYLIEALLALPLPWLASRWLPPARRPRASGPQSSSR